MVLVLKIIISFTNRYITHLDDIHSSCCWKRSKREIIEEYCEKREKTILWKKRDNDYNNLAIEFQHSQRGTRPFIEYYKYYDLNQMFLLISGLWSFQKLKFRCIYTFFFAFILVIYNASHIEVSFLLAMGHKNSF